MLAASANFLASLRTSHVVAISAELRIPGQPPFTVPVQGGSLTIDRTARIRRTGSVDLPWTTELARLGLTTDVRQLPFGSYVRLSRGIRYGDGTRELVQIGHMRVESVGWKTHEDTASLELADRMAQVADEPLLAPYDASGKKASAAAIALVTEVFGGSISYSSTVPAASEPTLTDVIYPPGDRAEVVASLALASGAEAYFDPAGNFRFDPVATVASSESWTIDAGADGVMVAADEALDRTRVYNGVQIEGQPNASTPPIVVLVVDSDPTSPTLWGGPFGKVARMESSTAVQTQAQATAAAQALLGNQLGLERQVRVSMVPNPLIVVGDTVRLVFPDDRSELHLVEAAAIPLDATSPGEIISRTTYRAPVVTASFYGAEALRELEEAIAA